MKQEETRHNSCRHLQQGGNHGNSHLGGTPFGGNMTASTSVIVIDDDITPRMGSGPMSSLPQLTGDDLKVLDFIEHMDAESSSGNQFNFQRFPGVHTS